MIGCEMMGDGLELGEQPKGDFWGWMRAVFCCEGCIGYFLYVSLPMISPLGDTGTVGRFTWWVMAVECEQ